MNKIGIMQGRLSPSRNGTIQFFPLASWKDEFYRAQEIGFDSIELVFESENYSNHPIWTDTGLEDIRKIIADSGVSVDHVCADYFMERPFIRVSEQERLQSVSVLKKLIERCCKAGISGIEVPMVDNSRIETEGDLRTVITSLNEVIGMAEKYHIEIGLETSLEPQRFKYLLQKLNHPLLKANYDTGNSASLGYDTYEEITSLGEWISNVHIKDRKARGITVPLGSGDADFERSFQALAKINYKGPFILQAAREKDGREMTTAKKNYDFLKGFIERYLVLL